MLTDLTTGQLATDLDPEAAAMLELELQIDADDRPRRPYVRRLERPDDSHLLRSVRDVATGEWTTTKTYPATIMARRLDVPRTTLQGMVTTGRCPGPDVRLGNRPAWSEAAARATFDALGHDFDRARERDVGHAEPSPAWMRGLRQIDGLKRLPPLKRIDT